MHDAITAEQMGVPGAAIITDRFAQTARVMAKVSGLPDYPFAVIPHPIAHNTPDVIQAKAEEAIRQILKIWLER